jgi:hypothetical protein
MPSVSFVSAGTRQHAAPERHRRAGQPLRIGKQRPGALAGGSDAKVSRSGLVGWGRSDGGTTAPAAGAARRRRSGCPPNSGCPACASCTRIWWGRPSPARPPTASGRPRASAAGRKAGFLRAGRAPVRDAHHASAPLTRSSLSAPGASSISPRTTAR